MFIVCSIHTEDIFGPQSFLHCGSTVRKDAENEKIMGTQLQDAKESGVWRLKTVSANTLIRKRELGPENVEKTFCARPS